jgi:hypothetical protein
MTAVAAWGGLRAARQRRRPHSLPISARLVAWAPAALAGAVVALGLVLGRDGSSLMFARDHLVEALVPLAAAMQAAFLFSPDDEPGLEVLLACPRPLPWTVLERLAVLLAWQGAAALAGSLAASALLGTPVLEGVARWLPPLLVLTGIALAVTLSTRQPLFSVALTLLLWFGMISNSGPGGGLLARWPYLWPLHVYLDSTHGYYWLNRAAQTLLGLNLVVLAAAYLLRDEERVLLGGRPRRQGGEA